MSKADTLDLDNLLANAEIGALYLDVEFRIRRVTPLVTEYTGISDRDKGKKLDEIAFLEGYVSLQEDVERCVQRHMELEREMEAPDFWNDAELSTQKTKELKSLKDDVATLGELRQQAACRGLESMVITFD